MAFDDADLHSTYHVAGETDHVVPNLNPPRKEKFRPKYYRKLIIPTFGVVVLTLGLAMGVYAVQRNQNIQIVATAIPTPTESPTPSPSPFFYP